MGLCYNLPVYKASYKLLNTLFIRSEKFKREYKYTVGQDLKAEGLNLIKNIYRANKTTNKVVIIQQARENLEIIRLLIRLMQDFGQLGLKAFVEINLEIEAVSKQLTAWEKWDCARIAGCQGTGERAQQIQ